jgi:acetolactate synthase I/II/III large subunit
MNVSDYTIDFLARRGVDDIFLVSGGGIMFLTDAVGRHPQMRYVCNFHEQACAIAAESYARVRNSVGACLVTTGPGSTNALSAIAGAFVDSVPVIVISGQVRRQLFADYSKLRQYGPQEINIEPMARPVVKYFKTLTDPAQLRCELERAWWHATTGRPGPVWINIPLDVQSLDFDPENSPGFDPPAADASRSRQELETAVAKSIEMLRESTRPIIIAGTGIHLGGAHQEFRAFVEALGAPVLSTIGGLDLLEESHPLYMGRFGPVGQRRANFALQNADLILSVGASMSISAIGFNAATFGPKAKRRIMVNIDEGDLGKGNYRPDLAVAADAGSFMAEALRQMSGVAFSFSPRWREACADWKTRYPTVTDDYYKPDGFVNSYVFARELSEQLNPRDVVVTGNSLDIVSVLHSFAVRPGQRVYTNINFGAMGWDLPGAIGAAVGRKDALTCLMTGDGSFQFNLQELLTIRINKLPIKIFVLNNEGYESIRSTQTNYFEKRFVGADFDSGIGNPDFRLLAAAYEIPYERIETNAEIAAKLAVVLAQPGPVLCELHVHPDQPRSPKIISTRREDGTMESRPLEDMFPFLSREELRDNMGLFDNEK